MLNDDAITPVEGDKLAIKGRSPSKHADAPDTPLSCSCELMSAESLGFSCRLYAGWWLANGRSQDTPSVPVPRPRYVPPAAMVTLEPPLRVEHTQTRAEPSPNHAAKTSATAVPGNSGVRSSADSGPPSCVQDRQVRQDQRLSDEPYRIRRTGAGSESK